MIVAAHQTMLAPQGGPSSLDYVQDSAFLFFDGIENAGRGTHASTGTTWKNLAGGPDASATSGCNATWIDDALQCNETGAYRVPLSSVTWPSSGMTIEIVFRQEQYGTWAGRIVQTYDVDYGRIDYYVRNKSTGTSDICWGQNGVAYNVSALTKAPPIYATMAIRGYTDQTGASVRVFGSTQAYTTAQYPRDKQANFNIGSNNNLNRGFRGDVCAVRVHSRYLTDAEVDFNAALDRQRFGVT